VKSTHCEGRNPAWGASAHRCRTHWSNRIWPGHWSGGALRWWQSLKSERQRSTTRLHALEPLFTGALRGEGIGPLPRGGLAVEVLKGSTKGGRCQLARSRQAVSPCVHRHRRIESPFPALGAVVLAREPNAPHAAGAVFIGRPDDCEVVLARPSSKVVGRSKSLCIVRCWRRFQQSTSR